MRLFEISDKIEAILIQGTDRETGEITEEALAALDELDETLAEKALNLAAYIKGENAEMEAVKAEAKRLTERAKVHERRAERLADYLARNIENGTKYSDARSQIGWRKSTVVEVDDEVRLHAAFIRRIPASQEVDKSAIKAAHKAGHDITGARVVERLNLQIK